MTSIRPANTPIFPGAARWIARAWVVEERYAVYLEYVTEPDMTRTTKTPCSLSWISLEEGIGGRLIEPVFKDEDDYYDRSGVLSSHNGNKFSHMDEDLILEIIQKEWDERWRGPWGRGTWQR